MNMAFIISERKEDIFFYKVNLKKYNRVYMNP